MPPTRLYLQSSGAAPISPAFDALWLTTTPANRFNMSPTKAGTTAVNKGGLESEIINPTNAEAVQLVGPPMAAQTINGNLSMVIKCAESSTSANASLQVVLRVVSLDGSVVRGVLYAGHAAANNATVGALGEEMVAVTFTTRIIPSTAMTQVVCLKNDRLVAELGSRNANTSASAFSTSLTLQDDQATDFALTSGLTTSLNPWLELSNTLDFNVSSTDLIVPSNRRFRHLVVR